MPLLDGRYQLLERIGSGGMGAVYRAHDGRLDREVAVKVLRSVDDPQHRSRLRAEARFAGGLHHPGIVRVFDYGEQHDLGGTSPYVVMQLVDGSPLAAPLPADEVARLLGDLGQALAVAHAAGIVHRDLKPSNILVTGDGRPVLVDFGVARSDDAEPLTETGLVIGTPDYLSPEQARGARATAASDIYALGVVAHQCLTGTSPFRRETPVATALAHLREEAPELPDTVPAELRALVRAMLARAPEHRPTAAEVASRAAVQPDRRRTAATVLGPMPTAPPCVPTPVAPSPAIGPWTRRRIAVVAATAAVLVVALLAAAVEGRNPTTPGAEAADPSAAARRASSTPDEKAAPASEISPRASTRPTPSAPQTHQHRSPRSDHGHSAKSEKKSHPPKKSKERGHHRH